MRMRMTWAALCVASLTAGCNDKGSTEPRSLDATYRLVSVNGFALPVLNAVYSNDTQNRQTVHEGTLTLHSNGTYKLDLTVGSNPVCYHDAGTFTVQGSQLDFESSQAYPVALLTSRAYTGGQLAATAMTFSQFGVDPLSFAFLQGSPASAVCYSGP